MAEAAHRRYARRLTALATDGPVLDAIAGAEDGEGRWLPRHGWVRTYGRFSPDRDPFATLVLETPGSPQAIARVDVSEALPAGKSLDEVRVHVPVLGWLRVTPFSSDSALSALPDVLAMPGRATVVRYRPGRRCTIRFDDGECSRFAKVMADDEGERIHAGTIMLWRAAAAGELGFAVAEPDRWDRSTRTLWQGKVEGVPITARLLGAEGPELAHRIGRAAASLGRARLEPEETFDGAAQLARSFRYGQELIRRVPGLAAAVSDLIGALSDTHAARGGRPLRPIHGAPHPSQWLDDGARLGLVDFDRLSLGDPELDAATFLGELDFESELAVPVERLAEVFLAAYESVAGPLDRRLLSAYRAHKRLARALRSARALRPDGDARAGRDLRHAIAACREAR